MLDFFKNITKNKSVAGLEINILPDGSHELNLIVLKKQKSTIVTEKQVEGIKSFEELAKWVDSKIPVVLVITGKGIIHRKISVNENDTLATLLNKVLPNTNLNEFNIQKTDVNTSHSFISVIRSNVLNELLEELTKNKLTSVFEFRLGPFVINTLLPLIKKDVINNENITIGNYQLQVREQQIIEITPASLTATQNIYVDNNPIPQTLLISYAAALSYFTENETGILNSELVNNLKEEFQQKQKFELRGWAALIITFIVLMINYFVFDNYWNKNNEINSQLVLTEAEFHRYEKLKIEFAQKKDFLEQNGLLENSRTSYYADQLAGELPNSIQWTGLNIHPLRKKKASDESKTLFFENKVISISGNCQRSNELNDWMKEVKKQKWVNDVTLVNYKQDNAKENGLFLIEVKLK